MYTSQLMETSHSFHQDADFPQHDQYYLNSPNLQPRTSYNHTQSNHTPFQQHHAQNPQSTNSQQLYHQRDSNDFYAYGNHSNHLSGSQLYSTHLHNNHHYDYPNYQDSNMLISSQPLENLFDTAPVPQRLAILPAPTANGIINGALVSPSLQLASPYQPPDFYHHHQHHGHLPAYNQSLLQYEDVEDIDQHNYNQHVNSFNSYLDSRIDFLKNKIDNFQRQLLDLEKLSNSPADQIQRLINSGHIDKANFGKVHTQIVIDAEQSINENVIKVNSIHKKFMGFEKLESNEIGQSNAIMREKVKQQQYEKASSESKIKIKQEANNSQKDYQNDQKSKYNHSNHKTQIKQQHQYDIKNQNQAPHNHDSIVVNSNQCNSQQQQVKEFGAVQKQENYNPQYQQFAISELDYKYAQAQQKLMAQSKKENNMPSCNPNSDPLGVQFLQQQMKKDSDYLYHLNYRPPQPNIFGNQRVQPRLSKLPHHHQSQHNQHTSNAFLTKYKCEGSLSTNSNQQSSFYTNGMPASQNNGSILKSHNKTLDMRTKDSKSYSSQCRKRSKYKMLNPDIKYKAVQMAKDKGAKQSAHHFGVPLKSLKRWMKVGWQRKKGGGRKTKDPEMEKRLYEWYQQMKVSGNPVTAKMIKDKAIQLRSCGDFIASKGWLDKFKIRYRLEISKESAAAHGTQIGNVAANSNNSSSSYNLSNIGSQSNK